MNLPNTTIFANDEVGHSGEEGSLCNDRFRHIFMELYEVYRFKHDAFELGSDLNLSLLLLELGLVIVFILGIEAPF